ncbi:hypothetical protein AMTRI_Chr05g61680 [Amborella trichopoda]
MVPNSDRLLIALIHLAGILYAILFFVIYIYFYNFDDIRDIIPFHSRLIQELMKCLQWASCLVIGLWCESWVSKLELWGRTMFLQTIGREVSNCSGMNGNLSI